jgi:uncharacterized membrane protein (UPF0127 family)
MKLAAWFCLAICIGAIGCGQGEKFELKTEPASQPAPIETKAPEKTPETTTKPGSEPVKSDPDDIHERVHQLNEYKHGTIEVNGKKIDVFLADSEDLRNEGFMYVEDRHVKDDQGMLFLFTKMQKLGFWMQNTRIDLDIAYIDDKGKIVSTHHMVKFDEKPTPAKGMGQSALEMKHGAFARLGIKEGMMVKIPPEIKAKD